MTETKRIPIRDIEFRVQIRGEGKPLLFFHGFGGSFKDWEEMLPFLCASQRSLYLISLKPLLITRKPLSFSAQLGYLKELIETLFPHPTRVDMISTSYGSAISWTLSQMMNLSVDQHVLINPMPLDPLRWIKSLELKFLSQIARSPLLLSWFLRTPRGKKHLHSLGQTFGMGMGSQYRLRNFDRRKRILVFKALSRFFWLARNEDWDLHLKTVVKSGRALIVFGDQDPLFHSEDFKQYEKLFADSQVYALSQGSHLLTHSHPQLLANLIDLYLQNGDLRQIHLPESDKETQTVLNLEKKAA